MNKCIFCFLLIFSALQAQISTNPSPVVANNSVTLTLDTTGTTLENESGVLYAHMGVTVNGAQWQNVKGSWGNNTTQPAFSNISGNTYELTISPDLYTYFSVDTSSDISQLCIVVRNAAGSNQTNPDIFIPVGAFQVTLTMPEENSSTIISSGSNFSIQASNVGGNANYNLYANGSLLNNTFNTNTYSYSHNNITSNQNYKLEVIKGSETITKKFAVIVNPGDTSEAMPTGLEDGINYNSSDPTKATLVLNAPGKDFVYVAGSFNNYAPNSNYAMKKDPVNGKFWLELTGLTAGNIETYHYWVVDETPTTGSPSLVKTADPFSTLVLSPYDDPSIPSSSYPNIPAYPEGQEREVTVLQTAQESYSWQVNDFQRPAKEKLIIYELLIRDFTEERTFQSLIERINYFKELNINAIELMPVMEFEGNDSWGYNTSFHLALDKYYGTQNKLKEFIDLCHQNGIAVILDVALNHVYGRSPLVRMWMNDPDANGWGAPAADNPYLNTIAKHTYSVGEDINHTSTLSQYYVKRTIEHWINEFRIDGLRWDLTKGFTQSCTSTDEACTNSYQQDRVDILKTYADYQWATDPSSYIIFEHLGVDNEEQQWANYRADEGKGIMMWGKMTDQYNQNTMGYAENSNFNRISYASRGFEKQRLLGYAESHDEERLMFKNITYGNANNPDYNISDLNTALGRMSALGAVLFAVPGPKMLWEMGELGYEYSINRCEDGSISGDCRLSPKPVKWEYYEEAVRKSIYDDWSRIFGLKNLENVFSSATFSIESGDLKPRIYIWDDSIPSTDLKNVVIFANFTNDVTSITPYFPYTGNWYNLMDNSVYEVTDTNQSYSLEPGEFRIFGNKPTNLNVEDIIKNKADNYLRIIENPSLNNLIKIDYNISSAKNLELNIFNAQGILVVSRKLKSNKDSIEIQNHLKTGTYFVTIKSENEFLSSKVLIK